LLGFVFLVCKPPTLFTVPWEVKPVKPIRDGTIVDRQGIVVVV
jgi:hypothetical protein